jgi:hypothetical protein
MVRQAATWSPGPMQPNLLCAVGDEATSKLRGVLWSLISQVRTPSIQLPVQFSEPLPDIDPQVETSASG